MKNLTEIQKLSFRICLELDEALDKRFNPAEVIESLGNNNSNNSNSNSNSSSSSDSSSSCCDMMIELEWIVVGVVRI